MGPDLLNAKLARPVVRIMRKALRDLRKAEQTVIGLRASAPSPLPGDQRSPSRIRMSASAFPSASCTG